MIWCYMSVQYQGVGAGGVCVSSHAERETEANLWAKKNKKTANLNTFFH